MVWEVLPFVGPTLKKSFVFSCKYDDRNTEERLERITVFVHQQNISEWMTASFWEQLPAETKGMTSYMWGCCGDS